jgi:hypothetical protein
MHQHGFSFSAPDYARGVSHYYYQRIRNPTDSDIVTGSFKRFWEEVYSERNEELMAYFWSSDADYYNLNISLEQVQQSNQISLRVYFEGAEVMSLPLQEAGERLFHVLKCLETLYLTCKPCTGEVHWSWVGVDFPIWATFGKELVIPDTEQPGNESSASKLIRRDLRETEHSPGYPYDAMYLLDPVPVPRSFVEGGNHWESVSLEKYYIVHPPALEEALASIEQHFMKPDGLLGKLEQGEGINEKDVQELEMAFQAMRDTWKEKTLVPKEVVRLVVYASNSVLRLEQCIERFPQHRDAIVTLIPRITEWIEGVFAYPLVNEESALTMVGQHIFGTRPFNLELILNTINKDSLAELLEALDILGQVWETREQISKFAAATLVDAPWLFDRVKNYFTGEREQRLQEAREQVMRSITRCLE